MAHCCLDQRRFGHENYWSRKRTRDEAALGNGSLPTEGLYTNKTRAYAPSGRTRFGPEIELYDASSKIVARKNTSGETNGSTIHIKRKIPLCLLCSIHGRHTRQIRPTR